MALDTVVLQGRFTSTGADVEIPLRSDVDFMYVYNETILNDAALAADRGAWFQWNRGMTQGRGLEYQKLGTVANDPITTVQCAVNAGFFYINQATTSSVTAPVAVTAITNAATPVISTANTGLLQNGSVVRLQGDTNVPNIMGFDFQIDTLVLNTSFTMAFPMANVPGAAGAGDGFYRQVIVPTQFYPRRRFIVNITQAAQAVITFSVDHGYVPNDTIRLVVPHEFGMEELNGLMATITAVDLVNNTVTVAVDTTAMTAFVFPAIADVPFTFAQAVPVGEVDALLTDATENTWNISMLLRGGDDSPAGADGDVIYWIAGKSFSVNNQ